jgi:hypothetical protein
MRKNPIAMDVSPRNGRKKGPGERKLTEMDDVPQFVVARSD